MSVRLHVLAGTLALFLLSRLSLSAQMEDADIIFRELRALDGTWFMPQDRGDRLQKPGRPGQRQYPESGRRNAHQSRRRRYRTCSKPCASSCAARSSLYHSTDPRPETTMSPSRFELDLGRCTRAILFEKPQTRQPAEKCATRLLGNRELAGLHRRAARNGRTVYRRVRL
jgi:hypothetical protein